MTVPVPDQLVYISDADGVTKTFPYPKRFLQKDEIVVLLRDADGVDKVQRLNIDYTIAGSAWQNGGDVIFYAAPSSGLKVVRYRMTQAKQTVDLANNQRNDAKAVELQLDRTIMAVQDQGTKINSINIGMMETLEKGKEAQKAAEDARDIAVDAASDAVSQGNVPIYSTLTAIASIEIPAGITAIRVNGRNVVGDGEGGLYIASNNGSSDTGISGGATSRMWYRGADIDVQRLVPSIRRKIVDPVFNSWSSKRVVKQLPQKGPDHDAILATYGYSELYPQGFYLDEQADEIYISLSSKGGDNSWNWVNVFDWATGEYKYCFSAGEFTSEGLAIIRQAGSKFAYMKKAGGEIGKFDITIPPVNMSVLSPVTATQVGLYKQISQLGDKLLIEVRTPPVGMYSRFSELVWLSIPSLDRLNRLTLDIFDSGFDEASGVPGSFRGFIPKRQGLAAAPGYIVASFGGNHIKGMPVTPYSYQGLRVFSPSGAAITENLFDPEGFISVLEAAGIPCTNIENEGCQALSSGAIISMFVHLRPTVNPSDSYTAGILFLEEFAIGEDALDFAAHSVSPSRFKRDVYEGGVAPRSVDGYSNPITGERFNTVADILDFMSNDIRRFSFYTSNVPSPQIKDMDGNPLPTATHVEIINMQNSVFLMCLQSMAPPFSFRRYRIGREPDRQTLIYPSVGESGALLHNAVIHSSSHVFSGPATTGLNPSDSEAGVGAQLLSTGFMAAARDGTVGFWQRSSSDGNLHSFFRGTSLVGGIRVTASGTTFDTTSDARLKEDDGELTFEQAKDVLELVAFHKFRWKETGEADEGVFAQELYEVYPKAVTVGGMFSYPVFKEDGTSIEQEYYQPWAVDYSKLVTVIGRCVQGVMRRLDEVEARLVAIEKR